MDKFRVGQVVRIVGLVPQSYPTRLRVGMIGTIVEQRVRESSVGLGLGYYYECEFLGEQEWMLLEEELAPIYDGDQASTWDACAWKPEKVRV